MKVMVNSVPKSGTHLLKRLLTLLGFEEGDASLGTHLLEGRYRPVKNLLRGTALRRKGVPVGIDNPAELNLGYVRRALGSISEGQLFQAHCFYSPELVEQLEENHIRVVGIYRDPRDVAVSYMHYLKRNPHLYLHEDYMSLPSDHDRLLVSIGGGKLGRHRLASIGEQYEHFLKWRNYGILMVSFEDLVGEQGGESDYRQAQTIVQVCEDLDIEIAEERVSEIQNRLFGVPGTFRKGVTGEWRREFSVEHKRLMKDVAGEMLVSLGYEKDCHW